MAEHHTLRPKAKGTVESTGRCACKSCLPGKPYVVVTAFPPFNAAALAVFGLGASVAVRLDAEELRKVASLCIEAAQELEQKQTTRGVALVRLN